MYPKVLRLVVMVLGLAFATPAQALAPNKLFNRALDLAKEGKTVEAVKLWLQVLNEVEPRYRPSVHKALGLAYDGLGQTAEAIYHLEAYLDTRMEAEAKRTRQRLARLTDKANKNLRRVTLACNPRSATLIIDGISYSCPITFWFAPGTHSLTVQALGYVETEIELDLERETPNRLLTIQLESAEESPEDLRQAERALENRIHVAARNGHASRIKAMALEHPEFFRGLSCKSAWEPAVKSLKPGRCRPDLFAILSAAGVEVCAESSLFRTAAEYGCEDAALAVLERLQEAKLIRTIWNLGPKIESEPSPVTLEGNVRILVELERRLNELCGRNAPDSKACMAVKRLDEIIEKFYRGVTTRARGDVFIGFLALHTHWTDRYRCAMVNELVGNVHSPEMCLHALETLNQFAREGLNGCPLADSLKHLERVYCAEGFLWLLPKAVPEDVAIAAREYNSGGYYTPRLMPQDNRIDPEDALKMGEALKLRTTRQCKSLGPDSDSCIAARLMEDKVKSIRTARDDAKKPGTIREELCKVEKDLSVLMRDLKDEKRLAELSGAPNRPRMMQLARQILPIEKLRDRLIKQYEKLGGRKWSAQKCR